MYKYLTVFGGRERMVGWWLYYERRKLNAEPKHTHKMWLDCRRLSSSASGLESEAEASTSSIMGIDRYLYTSHHITSHIRQRMEIDWFAYRFSFFFLTNNSFLFFLCFSFHFHFRGNVYVLFELNSVFLFNFHKPAFPPFFHSNPKRLWMVMSSSDCDCDCSPVLLRRFSSPLLSKCVAWCASVGAMRWAASARHPSPAWYGSTSTYL